MHKEKEIYCAYLPSVDEDTNHRYKNGFTQILQNLYHTLISSNVKLMYTPKCSEHEKTNTQNRNRIIGGNVLWEWTVRK